VVLPAVSENLEKSLIRKLRFEYLTAYRILKAAFAGGALSTSAIPFLRWEAFDRRDKSLGFSDPDALEGFAANGVGSPKALKKELWVCKKQIIMRWN